MAGQRLLDTARLQQTVQEYRAFQTAIHTFEVEYNALPGDLNNATAYWSGTANGDNDGSVIDGSEPARFWQHLALAGLIDGSYTGSGTTFNVDGANAGVNIPASNYDPLYGWTLMADATNSYGPADSITPTVTNGSGTFGATQSGGGFTAKQVFSIDTAVDDGNPSTGDIRANFGDTGSYTNFDNCQVNDTTYDLDNPTAGCPLSFVYR